MEQSAQYLFSPEVLFQPLGYEQLVLEAEKGADRRNWMGKRWTCSIRSMMRRSTRSKNPVTSWVFPSRRSMTI